MSWSDIGKTIAGFAPLLGGVVGGPVGAGFGAVVAEMFGVEDDPKAVAAAISRDPSAALKLRELELTHDSQLKQIKLDTLEAELKDVQNARSEHKHSIMPAVIVSVLTVGLIAFIAALMFINIPEANMRMIDMIFGSYLTAWIGSIQFWMGTTRSSAEKSKQMMG